jgi:CRP-like cAMP-binding protein
LAWQQSKFFYLLLSGSVSVEVGTRSYTLGIRVLGLGEAFGWSALLDHHDTLFQARAREQSKAYVWMAPSCRLLFGTTGVSRRIAAPYLETRRGRVQPTEATLAGLGGLRMRKDT